MMKSDVGPLAGDAIVVEHLVVRRGGGDVLPDLSVRVPAGQVVGLLGPSGGGKSTLMRAIVGVQQVESGADEGAVDRAIAAVDLTSHADVKVSRLSGGEHSRASLAAALVGSPEVLVLDEPTVGLDPVLRRDLWDLFRRLAHEEGRTLLVSSHVMDEATRCDRLLLLREGEILSDSTLADLLATTGAMDAEQAFLHLVDSAAGRTAERPPSMAATRDADGGAPAGGRPGTCASPSRRRPASCGSCAPTTAPSR